MNNKINRNIITTNISRHHYRTCANSKRMDNWVKCKKVWRLTLTSSKI